MSNTLQRVTTEYHDVEDRIRFSGELEQGGATVIWLTQRLLQRLVPALLKWLDGNGGKDMQSELMQSFAQQAARAHLEQQAPVAPEAGSDTWLATHIDVNYHEGAVTLRFRHGDDPSATLHLQALALRQWLNILHDAFVRGDWPLQCWPDWVRDSMPAAAPSATLH